MPEVGGARERRVHVGLVGEPTRERGERDQLADEDVAGALLVLDGDVARDTVSSIESRSARNRKRATRSHVSLAACLRLL